MLWSYILSQFKEAALTLAGRDIYALCLSLGRLHSGEKMVKSVLVLNQFCDLCCRTIGLIYHELWEKEMATHSCILAWRIPWRGEPGGLLSMRSHRVGHD